MSARVSAAGGAPRSRLEMLRAGTRQAHADIEAVPALGLLMRPELTMAAYGRILQHLHGFHAAVEPMVAAELTDYPDALAMLDGARPRALADDLSWLGIASATPTPPPIPELCCAPAALGALYVIEGSGLGARVIARQLRDSLDVGPGHGGSYYCGQDADAARQRWRRLCTVLEGPMAGPVAPKADLHDAECHDPESHMLAGACDTFRCLAAWMRRIETGAASRTADAHATT